MAELQAYSCDATTGDVLDRVPMSAFPYNRLLSAGSDGSVTIPLDGTFTQTELDYLLQEWSRIIVLERDGAVEYMGYSLGESYTRGPSSTTVKLADLWTMLARRLSVDHTVSGVEQWQETVTGNLAFQAARAVLRGREGVSNPVMSFPATLGSFTGGTSVTRTYYGYHLEYVSDVLSDLMDEGLDIYFRPRWITNGRADWQMLAGNAWSSGMTREFFVTADGAKVSGFSSSTDGARMTNNALRVGEGSEVDMLLRSNRNLASNFPLLERVSDSKSISDPAQLSSLSAQDLVAYGSPTKQWDFSVTADTPIDVGDTVRLHFDGDPRIPDGWHTRRVVKISGDLSETKKVGVQPVGGA